MSLATAYFFVFLMVVFTGAGQLFFKNYYRLNKKFIMLFLAGSSFVLAIVSNFLALKKLPVDVTYMATSLTIVMVLLISTLVWNERLSRMQWIGSALIVAGIIVYNMQ